MKELNLLHSAGWARLFLLSAWLLPCIGAMGQSIGFESFPSGTGYQDSGRTVLTLLCALAALCVFKSGLSRRVILCYGAFLGWSLLSALLSGAAFDSILFWQCWLAAGLFFGSGFSLREELLNPKVRSLVIHLPLAIVSTLSILPLLFEPDFLRIGGVFGLAGVLANWLLLFLPLALIDSMEKSRVVAILAGLAATLSLVAIIFTFSRAGWLIAGLELAILPLLLSSAKQRRAVLTVGGITLGLALLVVARDQFPLAVWISMFCAVFAVPIGLECRHSRIPKHHIMRLAGVIALTVLLGAGLFTRPSMAQAGQWASDRMEHLQGTDNSSRARTELWRSAAAMTLAHPILGVGPGEFSVHYPQFQRHFYYYSDSAHSAGLEMASETGILGLMLFAGTLWLLLSKAFYGSLEQHQRAAVLGLLCGLAYAQIDLAYHLGYLWMSVAGLLLVIIPKDSTEKHPSCNLSPMRIASGLALLAIAAYVLPPLRQIETADRSNYESALVNSRQALQRLPWWRLAVVSTFDWQMQLGQEPTRADTEQLLQVGSTLPIAHWLAAKWYRAHQQPREALASTQKAIELDPLNYPEFYVGLLETAKMLSEEELVKEATHVLLNGYPLEKLEFAPPIHRQNLLAQLLPALYNLADNINPYYNPTRTEPIYRYIYEVKPSPRAAFGLGISLLRRNKRKEAYPYLEEAHKAHKMYPHPDRL